MKDHMKNKPIRVLLTILFVTATLGVAWAHERWGGKDVGQGSGLRQQ